ncbi:MAG TPA: lysylphosphatidylglycerol synthase transmembrane domain-containing protein [Chitinophagaceae bacterium]|nr:lysylphosphatidylglycerol synthase transmembrane domain-containing protein [Chitinophagaceae bacterium]
MPRIIFVGFCNEQSIFTGLMKLNKNIKIFLNYVLGPLLFAWLSYSIVKQIKNQPHLEESWLSIKTSFSDTSIVYLIAVFLLMFANWSLEAVKWKLSVQRVQPVSFFKSLKAILSGVSFSVTTPNRMGEYLGRVLYMNEGNRLKVISLTVLGSLSQLIVTLFFGLLALFILKPDIIDAGLSGWSEWINIGIIGGSLAFIFLTVFYFRIGWLTRWIEKIPAIKKYIWLINELEKTDTTLLMRVLSISMLRYLVFATQYFLLFRFFAVEVNWWQGFWATALVFFIMAITPTIALFEVVQKISVTKEIFAIFTVNTLGIVFVTTTIWFINLVIPAIIGSLLIVGIKLFKKDEAS